MTGTTFPTIPVSSADPFERGRQYRTQAAEYIKGSVEVYEETFAYYTGLDWPEIRALAREFREPIAAYDERIIREIDGIAGAYAERGSNEAGRSQDEPHDEISIPRFAPDGGSVCALSSARTNLRALRCHHEI
jgi:hypothetical protein